MIIRRTIILAICGGLFIFSPVFADYVQMNKNLEDYSPPAYFRSPGDEVTAKNNKTAEKQTIEDKIVSEIQNLKSQHEKRFRELQTIEFLSNVDPVSSLQLAKIAENHQFLENWVAEGLKLNELEIIAGLRNPSIKAAQKKIVAELESFSQIMSLDDNLKQYSAFTEGLNNKIGPLKMKESIKQKYPSPGLTALKGRIIQQQVGVLTEKMNVTQKNIITEIRKAYWSLVFIEDSIRIKSETIDAFNRLKDVATTLYKSGKTSFQDIIKVNIRAEILKEDLVTLSSKKKNVKVKIRELLNLPVSTKLGNVIRIAPYKKVGAIDELYSLARQERQELKSTRFQINKVQDMIEMAESMIQDSFTLNFSVFEDEPVNSVGSDASKTSFPEKTMAGMKNNTPAKPWYGIDNPWLNQTRQNLLSLKQTLIKKENETDRMVRDSWFMVDKIKREYLLYKDRVLPLSKSALEVSTREYETGSMPFSQAIGSYTDWLKAKLNVAKKRADLGIAVANLEKTIGKSF